MPDTDSLLTLSEADGTELTNAEREPTLFSVLASRARGHPRSHLWAATLFGAADAIAILLAYPSAWWLASVSVSLSAYGVWGLADDTITRRRDGAPEVPDRIGAGESAASTSARVIRGAAAGVGLGAGLVGAFGFMAAALGTIIS